MNTVAEHSFDWQTPAALLVVAVALAWLVWRMLRARSKPGCGDACGCPTQTIKKKLGSKS